MSILSLRKNFCWLEKEIVNSFADDKLRSAEEKPLLLIEKAIDFQGFLNGF